MATTKKKLPKGFVPFAKKGAKDKAKAGYKKGKK